MVVAGWGSGLGQGEQGVGRWREGQGLDRANQRQSGSQG